MFRSYARFGMVVQLMAALLAGMGAELLWRSPRRRWRVACLTLAALAAAEYAVWPATLWRDVLPTEAHRWVVRQPGARQTADCSPITPASASVPWLTGGRISLVSAQFEDCAEPELAGRLAAAGYTHLLMPRTSPEARWMARQPGIVGFSPAVRFPTADVFPVIAPPPVVYTLQMVGFYPREYDQAWTWRWMTETASWRVRNTSRRTVAAAASVEMATVRGTRRLRLTLDGDDVQTLDVAEPRHVERIGPFLLRPGDHELAFAPGAPAESAAALLHNGDARALSFRIGEWHWSVGAHR